jgi:hypothetical protein
VNVVTENLHCLLSQLLSQNIAKNINFHHTLWFLGPYASSIGRTTQNQDPQRTTHITVNNQVCQLFVH